MSVCIPSHNPAHRQVEYRALSDIMALIRCACFDNLDILTHFTRMVGSGLPAYDGLHFADFPPRDHFHGKIVIPHTLMKQVTSLYQTMSEYRDTFAVVDRATPHVKVLIESPCYNICSPSLLW